MPLLNLRPEDQNIIIQLNELIDNPETTEINNLSFGTNKETYIRDKHQDRFGRKNGAKLSQISFFKRVVVAHGKDSTSHANEVSLKPLNKELTFKTEEVLGEIEKKLIKLFPDSTDPTKVNQGTREMFQKKYDEMCRQNADSIDETKNPGGIAKDAEQMANLRMAAWFSEQLEVLTKLEEKQEALKQSQEQIREMLRVENASSAKKVNVGELADRAKGTGKKEFQEFYPTTFWQEEKKKALIIASQRKREVENAKKAFVSVLKKEEYNESDLGAADPYSKDVADAKFNARVAQTKHYANWFTKGILTTTDALHTGQWRQASDYRNNLLAKLCNTSDFNPIRGQLEKLQDDKDRGFLSNEEFQQLFAFAKSKVDAQDTAQQEYLAKLQEEVEKVNKKILDRIKNNEEKGDDLNKLRMLQAFLLLSPFMPIAVAPAIFSAFAPFFEGMLGVADFGGSFFSVDGPFGQFAIITDVLEIDQAVSGALGLFDGVFSLPETIFGSEIGSAIFGSAAQLSASPLFSGLLPALMVEIYTNFTDREIEYRKERSSIAVDSKKMIDGEIAKLMRQHNLKTRKGVEEYLKESLVLTNDMAVAMKTFDWLVDINRRNSNVSAEILKQVFGDTDPQVAKIDALLKTINTSPDPKASEGARVELFQLLCNLKAKDHKAPIDQNAVDQFSTLLHLTISKPSEFENEVYDPIIKARAAISVVQGSFPSINNSLPAGVTAVKIADFVPQPPTQHSVKVMNIELDILGQKRYVTLNENDANFDSKLDQLKAANEAQNKIKGARDKIGKLDTQIPGATVEMEKELLQNVTAFKQAEDLGVHHDYLPAKGDRLLWKELTQNIGEKIDAKKCGINLYDDQNFSSEFNTKENLRNMVLINYLISNPNEEFTFKAANGNTIITTGTDIIAELKKSGLPRKAGTTDEKVSLADFLSNKGLTKFKQEEVFTQVVEKENRSQRLIVEEHHYLDLARDWLVDNNKSVGVVDSRNEVDLRAKAKAKVDLEIQVDGVDDEAKLKKAFNAVDSEYKKNLMDDNGTLKKSIARVKTSNAVKTKEILDKNFPPSPNIHVKSAEKARSGQGITVGGKG